MYFDNLGIMNLIIIHTIGILVYFDFNSINQFHIPFFLIFFNFSKFFIFEIYEIFISLAMPLYFDLFNNFFIHPIAISIPFLYYFQNFTYFRIFYRVSLNFILTSSIIKFQYLYMKHIKHVFWHYCI